MYTSTVTQKGQVTIPVEIRKKMKLGRGSAVAFTLRNGDINMHNAGDFLSLKGILRSHKKYDQKKARVAIAKDMTKHYRQTLK